MEPKKYTIVQILVLWAWNRQWDLKPSVYRKKLHKMMLDMIREAFWTGRDSAGTNTEKKFKEKFGVSPWKEKP
jgi:hypothetical protein